MTGDIKRGEWLAIGAFLIGVVLFGLWSLGPGNPKHGPHGIRTGQNNWAQLCAATDCEQYPLGWKSVKVGDGYVYLPMDGPDPERLLKPAKDRYFDVDATGKVLRVVDLDPKRTSWRSAGPCCTGYLDKIFNVPAPQKAGMNSVDEFTFYAPGHPPDRGYLNPHDGLMERADYAAFKSASDLAYRGLASFDNNFWLVKEDGVSSSLERRRVFLISKRPMMFGRYVWMDCGDGCWAATVVFTDDPRPEAPNAFVEWIGGSVVAKGPDKSACPDPSTNKYCEPSKTPYEALPATLAWMERLMKAMQRTPDPAMAVAERDSF